MSEAAENRETTPERPAASAPDGQKRFGCLQVTGIALVAATAAALVTGWAVKTYLFPSDFKPVTLTGTEESRLAAKLEKLESAGFEKERPSDAPLEPEPYSEKDADREIEFTEREINALVAKNTDLAEKAAIDFADDLVSARVLIPVDEDFPVLGGRVVRLRAGVQLAYRDSRPVVVLKGVSLMGVPLPNAWLGGMKNIDLVREFGTEEGFWKIFADGVEDIGVEDGRLRVTLRE
jgi:hypothetical protein